MLPSTNELRAFELFLKALEGVSSRQQYEERAKGFEKVAEKKNICFSGFLEKIATHIKQCGPANANRRGWGNMDNFNKKGFDNLMIFGPEEFVNIVKSGGDEVLKKFSFQFADAATASKSKSGILDPFQNEMNPKIWVFTEGQDLPRISEDLKEKILEKTQIFLDKYDMKLKALTLYGGNAGYQYGEGSDIDIGIYTEWPEERVPEYEEMLDFCRKELSFLHEGIEVHLFLKDPAEKEAVEANENVYEILTDTWLQKPKKLDVDPREELAPFLEKGNILVQKMQIKFDRLMSELKNLKSLEIDEVPVSYLEAFKPLLGIVKQLRVNRNIEHKALRKKAVNNEDITFFDRATQNEVAWKLLTETKMLKKLDEIKRILEAKGR